MPVRCWLIMFFVAQSMARVNRNDDEFGCCLQEKFLQKNSMSFTSFSGIPIVVL